MQLAENTGRKNDPKKSLSGHHRTTLSGYIFTTKACINIRQSEKNLLTAICPPHVPTIWRKYAEKGR